MLVIPDDAQRASIRNLEFVLHLPDPPLDSGFDAFASPRNDAESVQIKSANRHQKCSV